MDAAERRALAEEIVVSETWFFRDESVFRTLSQIAGRFRVERKASTLRTLSIPCATGEEAYSIAMVLLDSGLSELDFSVQAIDVSARALLVAERARYAKNSFRNSGWEKYRAYFEACTEGFQVVERARNCVTFARGNVLDAYPNWMKRFDVILCRNLLIYLDTKARARALENLNGWLADDGILFAGHAEAIEAMDPRFQRLDSQLHFAYRKRANVSKPLKLAVRASTDVAARALKAGELEQRSAPARRPPVNSDASPIADEPALLARATELADRGALGDAGLLCERHIRETGPSVEAYCLLGIVKQAGSESERAIDSFNKALYLNPVHYESLVHLALIHERRGDTTQAEQYRRRAERAHTKAGTR